MAKSLVVVFWCNFANFRVPYLCVLVYERFFGVINAIEAVIADVSVDGLIPVEALSLFLAVEAGVYSPSDVFGQQLHSGVEGHRYILWV